MIPGIKRYTEIDAIIPVEKFTAINFLDNASSLLKERGKTYDTKGGERSAAKVATAFNAVTGRDLSASEVWLILLLLKEVRQFSRKEYHQDSAEDAVAYTALMAEELNNENNI